MLLLLLLAVLPVATLADESHFHVSRCCAVYALGAAGATGIGVATGLPLALGLIGFGAAGPVAGGVAAAWQTAMAGGTVGGAGAFALLQSMAMAGVGGTAIIGSGIAGGAAMIAFCGKLSDLGLCAPLQAVGAKL